MAAFSGQKKGNRFYLIYLFVSVMMLFSCNSSTIKDKIDGGNYKFWFSFEETGVIVYYYFGSDGRYEVFIKNETNGFHRYNTVAYENDLIPNKWILKDDSIGWGTDFYQIVNLEENRMVIKYKYRLDTLFSCYDGMIPERYNHKW